MKIGCHDTASQYNLTNRYQQHGFDVSIVVWDVYFNDDLYVSLRSIEREIHNIFHDMRLWSNRELFYRQDRNDVFLIGHYRTQITEFIWKSPILREAYVLGMKYRRNMTNSTDQSPSLEECRLACGNLYLHCKKFEGIYSEFDKDIHQNNIIWTSIRETMYNSFSDADLSQNEVSDDNLMEIDSPPIQISETSETHGRQVAQSTDTLRTCNSPPIQNSQTGEAHDHVYSRLRKKITVPRKATNLTDTQGTIVSSYSAQHSSNSNTQTLAGNKRKADAISERFNDICDACTSSQESVVVQSGRLQSIIMNKVYDADDMTKVAMKDPLFSLELPLAEKDQPPSLKTQKFFDMSSSISTLPEFERDQLPHDFKGDDTFITILDSKIHGWIDPCVLNAFGISYVECKYRMYNNPKVNGCSSIYELQLTITEKETSSHLVSTGKCSSMVLLESSPLLSDTDCCEEFINMRSFKVRTYREAVFMLLAIMRIYSSPCKERFLKLDYMRKSQYQWDHIEAEILKALKFSNTAGGSYCLKIPTCSQALAHENRIVVSSKAKDKYAKGGTIRNYDNFLRENHEYFKYSETEYEEALRYAKEITERNFEQALREESESYREEQANKKLSQDSVDQEFVDQRYRSDEEDSNNEEGSDKGHCSDEEFGEPSQSQSQSTSSQSSNESRRPRKRSERRSPPDPPAGASQEEIVALAMLFYYKNKDYESVLISSL